MDESGPLVDESGPLMDESGPLMDESGPLMDESGPLVPLQGRQAAAGFRFFIPQAVPPGGRGIFGLHFF